MTAVDESPLVHIASEVHRRAQRIALDVTTADGDLALRRLIGEEIEAWQADVRRGLHATELADTARVAERVHADIARQGPLSDLLADPDVWEVMINAPDQIFVRRHDGPSGYHHEVFVDDDHVVRTITRILDTSSVSHRKLDPAEGLQDAQLDDGSRLHIVHGDISRGGHLMVNIRRFTGMAFARLDDLVANGTIDPAAARFLAACVRARRSIVFAGAPGAGKTTLMSCATAELDPALRVVIAEEVFEADVAAANVASMQTRPPRPDRPGVDLRRLVAGFLRMAPDVAIVGEVRDREALPLLLTLSSGVTGYTTIHASGARQALTRLRFICQLADTRSELPMSALNSLVAESIDLVVHSRRTPDGPRVMEIVAVEDGTGGAEATQFTVTEVFRRTDPGAPLAWTGVVPVRLAAHLDQAGTPLASLLTHQAGPPAGNEREEST